MEGVFRWQPIKDMYPDVEDTNIVFVPSMFSQDIPVSCRSWGWRGETGISCTFSGTTLCTYDWDWWHRSQKGILVVMGRGLLALGTDEKRYPLGLPRSRGLSDACLTARTWRSIVLFISTVTACKFCGSNDSLAHRNAKRPATIYNSRFGLQFPETACFSLQCSFHPVRFH